MNVDMAKRLVDRRRAAGLSQEALAEELGVSRQAVSKWERSESSPDTDNLIALAALYGVSLDDLLYQDVAEEADEAAAEGAGEEGAAAAPPCAECEGAPAVTVEAEVIEEGPAPGAAVGATASAAEGDAPCSDGDGPAEAPAGAGFESKDGTVHIGPDGIHVQEPGKGDYVHVTWRDGVHVRDGGSGDEVHVGWDGVHVNDHRYNSWHDAHHAWEQAGCPGSSSACGPHSRGWRSWNMFPFPLVVIVIYIVTAFSSDAWVPELALFLTIPAYYALGGLLFGKRVCAFLCTLYALGTVGWFFQMCLMGQPHPAWVVLLTIPLVTGLFSAISHWWRRRKHA